MIGLFVNMFKEVFLLEPHVFVSKSDKRKLEVEKKC